DVYDDFVTAHERNDWVRTPASEALYRNNQPLLAYIAGPAAHVTSKEHNYFAGETAEKQLVIINNSRIAVEAQCTVVCGTANIERKTVTVKTGEQERIPLSIKLTGDHPAELLIAVVKFSNGEEQKDSLFFNVLPKPEQPKAETKIALF